MSARIALVAGEASGDQLGARLIAAIKRHMPDAQFFGIGGPQMQREGFDSWYPSERLAVNGFGDALKRVPELLGIRRGLIKRIVAEGADLFIGIDAPDFNIGVEKRLKRRGLKTIHYVSPSIWAWRGGRAKKIRDSADHVLCLFPCEPELYARHGVAASFVGHPLADEFPLIPDRNAMRETLCLPADSPVVAMMPGSRAGEVDALADSFVAAAKLIAARLPEVRFLVPLVTRETRDRFARALYESEWGEACPVTIMIGHGHEAMIAADVVLLASGTAALEAALLKRPMVVAYRISSWSYRILKRMMYLPWVSLPNILLNSEAVPELLQENCIPEKLADAVSNWFSDGDARDALISRFTRLHQDLRRDNAARAAAVVLDLLP